MRGTALAITDDHTALADSVLGRLERSGSRAAARATLSDGPAHPPELWRAAADLGLPGLAVAEQFGGAGFGLSELAIVLEAQGRELTPAPSCPLWRPPWCSTGAPATSCAPNCCPGSRAVPLSPHWG